MTDANRIRSIDARPGDIVEYQDGTHRVIKERKKDEETLLPGWWLEGGGGLADLAIDNPNNGWTIVRPVES